MNGMGPMKERGLGNDSNGIWPEGLERGVVTDRDGEGCGRSWSEHINFKQPIRHSRHFVLIRVAYFLLK